MRNNYLEQSGYRLALRLERVFSRGTSGLMVAVLGAAILLTIAPAVFFLNEKLLGLALLLLSGFLAHMVYWLFVSYLQRDRAVQPNQLQAARVGGTLGVNLTFFVAQIIEAGGHWDRLFPRAFFLFLLRQARFVWLLRRLNIPIKEFAEMVRERYQKESSLPLPEVLQRAWQKALELNHLRVRYSDLLVAIYEVDKTFQEILFAFDIEEQDIREVAYWQRRLEAERATAGRFWDEQKLLDIQGIGKNWSGGYTVNLDQVATELTESVKLHPPPSHLYGRGSQVDLLARMLLQAETGGNVVLVGLPGVGRHTVLAAFAHFVVSGQTFGPLRYKRLLQIDSGAIIGGTSSLAGVLDKIKLLFGEAYRAEHVILVINNIDAFLDRGPEAGRVNATEALLPFLKSRLRIIGITTPQGYQSTIGRNTTLTRLFGKLEIVEPSQRETSLILQDTVGELERQSGLFFTHQALKEIVNLTGKLIQNLPNPEKAIEVLEETATTVATRAQARIVTSEHVQAVVEDRTKVPVRKVAGKEREVLLQLESILHQRVIGQEVAISEIANALRRARAGVRSEKRPIAAFLFLGPTGVGKTETVRTLAGVYFGNENRIIRFDMSEFQEVHSIDRLIGNADTREAGRLTEAVIDRPFSLILLDELEKAHPQVLDIFLQVFDEGRLTDALGRTVNFTNTMIIATSNAGAELIRQMVKSGQDLLSAREELLNHLQSQGIFRPEFLNRFDAIIMFRPLSEEELTEVAKLLLTELNQRLKEKDVQIKLTPELAAAVARGGYSPEFGARSLRRYIQEHIENYVAKGLVSGEIKRGDVVEVSPESVLS